jgi:putative transcriptional regulator
MSKGMIRTRFDELLKERRHSLYWLAKEAHVAYTTLWKLKTAGSQGISFAVLERVCEALNCEPGDVLVRDTALKKKNGHSKRE